MTSSGVQDQLPMDRLLYGNAYCVPALDSTTLDNVRDSILIHLLELLRAACVECDEFRLRLSQLCLGQIVTSEFPGQLVSWLNWHK